MKLLLATDGSVFSAAATQAVIAEVKRDDADVRAMHVVDTREGRLPEASALDENVISAPARRRSAEALVEATAELLRAQGFKATTVLVWGDPRSQIIEAAKEWGAELIVMGSHGQTHLERFLMGSVSEAVAHYAPCSVEIVRAPTDGQAAKGFRILLPVDDSDVSDAAVDAVIAGLRSEGAEVKLMRVVDPFPLAEALADIHRRDSHEYPDLAGAILKLRERATRKLEKTAEKLEAFGFKVTQTIVEEGDLRDNILDCASRWGAGLIVVGSHGPKAAKRSLIGSVSEAVSRYAACSTEIVRLQDR